MPPKVDTLYSLEIPEGVDLQAELAGFIPRALAYSIDFLLRACVLFVLLIISAFFDKVGQGLWLIAFFLLEWLYPVLFEVYKNGQTIGKKCLGIKVVTEELVTVKLQPSLIRNLLRVADFLPLFYVFGMLSIVFSKRFQRLGDLAAGTIVIYTADEKSKTLSHIPVEAIAPPVNLSAAQQTAIIQFAQNRSKLSASRQAELAEILVKLVPNNSSDPVAYLQGVGKWLLGER
ncbi:MAG: RDD family protein [Cellvibrionaceae bacterium]